MTRVLAGFALVLVLGCHGDDRRCAAQVAELREWMQAVAAEGYGVDDLPFPRTKLVAIDERGETDAIEAGPVLILQGTRALLDGTPAADTSRPAEAASRMRAKRDAWLELWRQTNPGRTPPEGTHLLVVLSPTDAWSDIATVLDAAAQAGYAKATFVFDRKTSAPPPKETPVSRELARRASGESIDPTQTARKMAEAAKNGPRAFARCPEVPRSIEAWASSHAMTPDEKSEGLATRVPDGIESCHCKVDFDEVQATYWFMLGRYVGSPKVLYTLTLAPSGAPGATAIAVPGTEPWSTAYVSVVSAAKHGQRVSVVAR